MAPAPALPPLSSSSMTSSASKRTRDAPRGDTIASVIKKPRWGAPPPARNSKLLQPTAIPRTSAAKSSSTTSTSVTATAAAATSTRTSAQMSADDLASVQHDSLHMSNEQLRSENEQLQVEVTNLEDTMRKLEQRLANSDERVAALERERTRYRESSSCVSAATASAALAQTANASPDQQGATSIGHAVKLEIVSAVEATARDELATERERDLDALRLALQQQQHDVERAMQRMQRERTESDAFDALERRVLDDRVAELEVQLAQNRLREAEKDGEITRLRTEQQTDDDTRSTTGHSDGVAVQRDGDPDGWRVQCERLQDELNVANSRALELEVALRAVQLHSETRAFEALEKRMFEERINELEMQVKTQTQTQISDKTIAALEKQRLALVDDLEAAQLQLRVADAEANVKRNEVARLLHDREKLKKQVNAITSDLARVAAQADEFNAQAQAERVRAAQLADDVARLQQAHDVLASQLQQQQQTVAAEQHDVAQQVGQQTTACEQELTEQQATDALALGAPTGDASNSSSSGNDDDTIARLEREKRELQAFFQCYYEAAEAKCRQLLHALAQSEAQQLQQQQLVSSATKSPQTDR